MAEICVTVAVADTQADGAVVIEFVAEDSISGNTAGVPQLHRSMHNPIIKEIVFIFISFCLPIDSTYLPAIKKNTLQFLTGLEKH